MARQGGRVRFSRRPRAPNVSAGGSELARLQLVRMPVSAGLAPSSLYLACTAVPEVYSSVGTASHRVCDHQSDKKVSQLSVAGVIRVPQAARADS